MYEIDGNFIRLAREQQHRSREELARLVCLSHRHIQQLEDGKSSIFFNDRHRYHVALRVADVLNLVPDSFIREINVQSDDISVQNTQNDPLGKMLKCKSVSLPNKNTKHFRWRSYKRYFLAFVSIALAISCAYAGYDLFQKYLLATINFANLSI